MGMYCKCGDVCEITKDNNTWDLRTHVYREKSCPTQRYYVYSMDSEEEEQTILDKYPAFDTWEEAEEFCASDNAQCDSCLDCIKRGLDRRATGCYSLRCIASGRWLRRMANGAWRKHRIRVNRRAYDRNYKKLRRR